jgi:putative DNA primase/helicase
MQLYARLAPREHVHTNTVFSHSQADTEVLEKASHARNGQNFTALYRGDTSGYRSKSEADFVLVLRLLYWCNDDIVQVRRLFIQSGLYDPVKTESPRGDSTYL